MHPENTFKIIKTLKEKIKLPVSFGTRNTMGFGDISSYEAACAGSDSIDCCVSVFSGKNSFISCESLACLLKNKKTDTSLNMEALVKAREIYLKFCSLNYADSLNTDLLYSPDPVLSDKNIPGRVRTMLKKELFDLNAEDSLEKGIGHIEKIQKDLGSIPFIYPLDKMMVTQAVNNLIFDEKEDEYKIISKHVKDHCLGKNGKTSEKISAKVISLAKKIESFEESSSEKKDHLSRLNNRKFLELIFPDKETSVSRASEALKNKKTANCRKFNVYINNNFYEVEVDTDDPEVRISDYAQPVFCKTASSPKKQARPFLKKEKTEMENKPEQKEIAVSEKGEKFRVNSPMPGTIVKLLKNKGDIVEKNEAVLVLEAMKMENPILSPAKGKIESINFNTGETALKNDILFEINGQ